MSSGGVRFTVWLCGRTLEIIATCMCTWDLVGSDLQCDSVDEHWKLMLQVCAHEFWLCCLIVCYFFYWGLGLENTEFQVYYIIISIGVLVHSMDFPLKHSHCQSMNTCLMNVGKLKCYFRNLTWSNNDKVWTYVLAYSPFHSTIPLFESTKPPSSNNHITMFKVQ